MTTSIQKHPTTLNARVGAVALGVAAIGTVVLALGPEQLAPLSLFTILIATFGLWALSDEMGMKKPLVRAAFVAFAFAAAAKSQALLNLDAEVVARHSIFYAFSVLLALLLWSGAFLHREKELKIVGTLGVIATTSPIILLIAAHVVVGMSGIFGFTALFSIADGSLQTRFAAIDNIDFIFAGWAILASLMLWRGYIRASER